MQTDHATDASLRLLLREAVDYAGMFPPAALSLSGAAELYRAYRNDADAWMLGKFICPVGRLDELAAWLERRTNDSPWPVSVLATGAGPADSFQHTLLGDLSRIRGVQERRPALLDVQTMEARWPGSLLAGGRQNADAFVQSVGDLLSTSGTSIRDVFFELPANVNATGVRDALEVLRAHNDTAPGGVLFGAKVRCGGADAEAFPSSAHLASFMAACCGLGLPFKATAGLHHPFYHFEEAMGAHAHGFLNLSVAAALAAGHLVDEAGIVTILTDSTPEHFAGGEDGLAYKHLWVTPEQITHARQTGLVSFGSCSFDEPREDLRALGWLH